MFEYLRRMGPVTKNLLIINLLVWLFCQVAPVNTVESFVNLFGLHYFSSPGFKIWQLFTYMFIQTGFMHLFFNMFALVMFGTVIEYAIGRDRFLFYYLSCGVGAALIQEGVYAAMLHKYYAMFTPDQTDAIINLSWEMMRNGSAMVTLSEKLLLEDPTAIIFASMVNAPTIGASGAVFGILLAFAMLWPNRPLYIMFIPVPVKAKWVVIAYALIELTQGLGGFNDNVAHFAHLGGMAVGFIIIWYWNRKGTFNGWY